MAPPPSRPDNPISQPSGLERQAKPGGDAAPSHMQVEAARDTASPKGQAILGGDTQKKAQAGEAALQSGGFPTFDLGNSAGEKPARPQAQIARNSNVSAERSGLGSTDNQARANTERSTNRGVSDRATPTTTAMPGDNNLNARASADKYLASGNKSVNKENLRTPANPGDSHGGHVPQAGDRQVGQRSHPEQSQLHSQRRDVSKTESDRQTPGHTGEHKPHTGEHKAHTGEHKPHTGEHTPHAGEQKAHAGDKTEPGDQRTEHAADRKGETGERETKFKVKDGSVEQAEKERETPKTNEQKTEPRKGRRSKAANTEIAKGSSNNANLAESVSTDNHISTADRVTGVSLKSSANPDAQSLEHASVATNPDKITHQASNESAKQSALANSNADTVNQAALASHAGETNSLKSPEHRSSTDLGSDRISVAHAADHGQKGAAGHSDMRTESRKGNDDANNVQRNIASRDREDDLREAKADHEDNLQDRTHKDYLAFHNNMDQQGAIASHNIGDQSANINLVVNQQTDLARHSSPSSGEANVTHAIHNVVSHVVHSRSETTHRGEGKIEDLSVRDPAHTGANANQSHTSTSHTGTGHGTTPGQHDPSSHTGQHGHHSSGQGHHHGAGHQHGTGIGIGHGPAGTANDPSGKGHDPNQSNDPLGKGHDPNQSNDPSGKGHDPNQSNDPSGKGHDPNQSNDPSGKGHDPNQSNDPSGKGHDPNGHDPNGQVNGSCNPGTDPGGHNGMPGTDPNCGNLPGGLGNVPYVVDPSHYAEMPVRFLSTLLSEMGNVLDTINHTSRLLDPVSPTSPFHHNLADTIPASTPNSPIGSGSTSIYTETAGSETITNTTQPPTIGQSVPVIDQPIPVVNGNGSAVPIISDGPGVSQLPVIETSPTGGVIHSGDASNPTGNTSSPISDAPSPTSGSGSNATTGGAQEASSTLQADSVTPSHIVNGQLTGQVSQDVSNLTNQPFGNPSQYLVTDPYSNSNANNYVPHAGHPVNDPVPTDNLGNSGQINDPLLNYDQLASAAGHHAGIEHHAENNNLGGNNDPNNQPRADLNDLWSSNDAREGHKQPENELQQRLDQVFSEWQDPYNNKGGKNTGVNSSGISDRNPATKNDSILGQIVTLMNDLNKNKKQVSSGKAYVVQAGDTLESIANKVLRDKRLGLLIYLINQANLIKEVGVDWQNTKLIKGMVLYLPSNEEIVNFRSAMVHSASQDTNNGAQWRFDQQYLKGMEDRRHNVERLLGPLGSSSVSSKYDPETGRQCVTVRLGDTLRSIALKHPVLNDVSLWKILAKCNNLSTEVDAKGVPIIHLTRGMLLQLPGAEEIAAYRASQAVIVRAESPRKAIAAEVLGAV